MIQRNRAVKSNAEISLWHIRAHSRRWYGLIQEMIGEMNISNFDRLNLAFDPVGQDGHIEVLTWMGPDESRPLEISNPLIRLSYAGSAMSQPLVERSVEILRSEKMTADDYLDVPLNRILRFDCKDDEDKGLMQLKIVTETAEIVAGLCHFSLEPFLVFENEVRNLKPGEASEQLRVLAGGDETRSACYCIEAAGLLGIMTQKECRFGRSAYEVYFHHRRIGYQFLESE